MKLKSSIPVRRDGSHAEIAIGDKTYTADEAGVYDVPDDVAETLLQHEHFESVGAKGSKGGKGAGKGAGKDAGKDGAKTSTVLVNEDGEKVDLGAMDRDALVEFAMTLGLDLIESPLDKDGMIAAVVEAASKAE